MLELCENNRQWLNCICVHRVPLMAPLPQYCVWDMTPPEIHHDCGIELHSLAPSSQIDMVYVHNILLQELDGVTNTYR